MQNKVARIEVLIFFILLCLLTIKKMVILSQNKYEKKISKYGDNLDNYNLDISYIMKNPIYTNFHIEPRQSRKRVNLLVIVTSAPSRIERRNAIRDTWWRSCQNNTKVYV